jgi:hypothetical protein
MSARPLGRLDAPQASRLATTPAAATTAATAGATAGAAPAAAAATAAAAVGAPSKTDSLLPLLPSAACACCSTCSRAMTRACAVAMCSRKAIIKAPKVLPRTTSKI